MTYSLDTEILRIDEECTSTLKDKDHFVDYISDGNYIDILYKLSTKLVNLQNGLLEEETKKDFMRDKLIRLRNFATLAIIDIDNSRI